MPPDRRIQDPRLNWPIPIVNHPTAEALREANHLQRLRHMATGQPVRSLMDMASSLHQALNQPGMVTTRQSPLRDPYAVHFHNGLPVPDTRNRANPQVTRGYILPFSSRQENAGLNNNTTNTNNNNNNNNNNSNNNVNQQQGGSQNESISVSSPFVGSYPIPGYTQPQQDHAHLDENLFGASLASSQAPARPEYSAYIQPGQANQGSRVPSAFPTALGAAVHQSHQEASHSLLPQSTPWIRNGNAENDLNNASIPTTTSATNPLSSVQTTTAGNHPPASSVTLPSSLTQRRRSAHVMASENPDQPTHESRVGSDGITRRRVRMRPLRVSPASSSRHQPHPPPAPPPSTSSTNTTTSPPAPPATRPSYGEVYLTSLAADTYMDSMNRTMDAVEQQNQLYMLRHEREARRRLINEDFARTKEIGLDNQHDGRPEPKDSESLIINMECKVCMSQLVDTVLMPCGHAILCRWCAEQYIQNPRPGMRRLPPSCPMCRKPVRQRIRIFIS